MAIHFKIGSNKKPVKLDIIILVVLCITLHLNSAEGCTSAFKTCLTPSSVEWKKIGKEFLQCARVPLGLC